MINSMSSLLDCEFGPATHIPVSSPLPSLGREPINATDEMLPPTSHQAAHAVLFINELLCDIVGRLPFEDIMSATSTCKSWRSVLTADHNIQESLFLKPAESREVLCENHLINRLEDPIAIEDCLVICKFHPRIRGICGPVQVEGVSLCLRPFPKFDHPNGNWRNMFVAQPPCKTVTVNIRTMGRVDEIEFQRSAGVTLGELYDFIHSGILDDKLYPNGWLSVASHVDENDESIVTKRFSSRCGVAAGVVVCRPANLPLEIISSDTDSSDDLGGDDWSDDYYDTRDGAMATSDSRQKSPHFSMTTDNDLHVD